MLYDGFSVLVDGLGKKSSVSCVVWFFTSVRL